jgi:hypothetical protein
MWWGMEIGLVSAVQVLRDEHCNRQGWSVVTLEIESTDEESRGG